MFESNDGTAHPSRAFHSIGLKNVDGQWLASSAGDENDRAFLPFYIPLPPRRLIDWLVVVGHRFWRQRRRCMAALLLVDCCSGHWTLRLPHQRCGTERADWSTSHDDFKDLPDSIRVGGVFQTVAGATVRQECLPVEDGFHFILSVISYAPMTAMVRHSAGIERVEPIQIVTNDWEQTIDAAMPRLRIA